MEMAKKNQRYTVQDFLSWEDNNRWELIDGIVYTNYRPPSVRHQEISQNLLFQLSHSLGKKYTIFIAPLDVIFSEESVVQPDLFVIEDAKKITPENIQGAPDVIFEIISPNTCAFDKREKKVLYQRYGVREYIILDPVNNYGERCKLNSSGRYDLPEIYDAHEILILTTLESIQIPLGEVFGVDKNEAIRSPLLDKKKRYTFQDYLAWNDGRQWKLIDGVPSLWNSRFTINNQDVVE